MAERDDITVGMKVKLDKDSIERDVRETEAKINQKGKVGQPRVEREQKSFADRIGQSIKGTLEKVLDKIAPTKEGQTGLGVGLIGGLIGLKLVKELYNALSGIVRQLYRLSAALRIFDPHIMQALRMFHLRMRLIAFQLAQAVSPAITEFLDVLGQINETLFRFALPALKLGSMVLATMLRRLNMVVTLIDYLHRQAKNILASILGSIGEIFMVLSHLLPMAGEKLYKAGEFLVEVAEKLKSEQTDATRLNRAWLEALTNVVNEAREKGVIAPTDLRGDPNKERSITPYRATPSKPVEERGPQRKAVPPDSPALTQFHQTVNMDMDMRLAHEEAVQRAIEEIRSQLMKGVVRARNESMVLAGMLKARTVVDSLI